MTGCSDGQFTCHDGQCVRMEESCDQVVQCRDKSDEKDCRLIHLEESYKKNVAPITTVSATNFTVVPTPVSISITLLKIVDMEETNHKIEFQFKINMEWYENERVKYHNLKEKTALNALSDDDINKLWLPLIIYANTDQKELTRLGVSWEWNTYVSVIREGKSTSAPMTEVDEAEVFEGSDNKLAMHQTYAHVFQCIYQLQYYPFDTQVNTVLMYIIDYYDILRSALFR